MAVTVELVPFLEELRALYRQPRGLERFQAYLGKLRSSTGEMELPISNVNPMAKPHALACVEGLLALDAERVAIDAAREAAAAFDGDESLRLLVIVIDDAAGGGTNRWFAQHAHRYERRHEVQRGWVTVPCWSSEVPSAEAVERETRAALYRTLDERRHGVVRTLGAMLDRESRALAFAGIESPYASAEYRAFVEPYLGSNAAPVVMAALYGNDVAATLGYPPLARIEALR